MLIITIKGLFVFQNTLGDYLTIFSIIKPATFVLIIGNSYFAKPFILYWGEKWGSPAFTYKRNMLYTKNKNAIRLQYSDKYHIGAGIHTKDNVVLFI